MNWYEQIGSDGDIVLCTRVRLARNLEQFAFPYRLEENEKNQVNDLIKNALSTTKYATLKYINMSELQEVEAISLAEKHLISPEFASSTSGRALLLNDSEEVSIMLCEDDHVRVQVLSAGLSLEQAFEKANDIDCTLGEKVNYAFNENLGYLTQCPTNLGTGMRASVMLHLPAISMSGGISRLMSTVAKLGLTLRGTYGDIGEAVGEIYQLSNQVTMGISEQAAIANLHAITSQIVAQEKAARENLVNDSSLIDKVQRAFGVLNNAHMISFTEFINLISYVRLGSSIKILDLPLNLLNTLLITLQPATMNCVSNQDLTPQERDLLRAKYIKDAFCIN